MLYISRGCIVNNSSHTISFRGNEYTLSQNEWIVWKNGQFALARNAKALYYDSEKILDSLFNLGLVVVQPDESEPFDAMYNALAQSIILPQLNGKIIPLLFGEDKKIMDWIRRAGFTLTTEELMYLIENGIHPSDEIIGAENKQALIATIYPDEKIEGNILIKRMFNAKCRNNVVISIFSMLQHGYIYLN